MQVRLIPKRIRVAALAMLFIATWSTETQAEETIPSLRWKNGDTLPGQFAASRAEHIRWKSPQFEDTLTLDPATLDRVTFPKRIAPPTESFQVTAVTGDAWVADLIAANVKTFLFSSKRFGQMHVPRGAVLSMERRDHPRLAFRSTATTEGWVATDPSDWQVNHLGHIETKNIRADAFRPIALPKRFEVDVAFQSTRGRTGFILALGKNLRQVVRLETWGNEVVLVQGARFEPVLTLEEDQHEIHLRIAFDADKGIATVFDANGRLLAQLDKVRPAEGSRGLFVRNRGFDLTIQSLRVFHQNSNQPFVLSKPRVHMVDGQVLEGRLFVDKSGARVTSAGGISQSVDLGQVDRILSPDVKRTDIHGPASLTYGDGAIVRGSLVELDTNQLVLKTAFSSSPVICSLTGASLLRLGTKEHQASSQVPRDRLMSTGGTLHGQVSFAEDRKAPIRWKPLGAVDAVRLANAANARIQRSRASMKPAFDAEAFTDALHLRSQEIIPCRVVSWNEKKVVFESPFVTTGTLPPEKIKGIELGRTPHTDHDFTSSTWKGTPGIIQRDEGLVVITKKGHRIWHPDALAGREVRFNVKWGKIRSGVFSISAFHHEDNKLGKFSLYFDSGFIYVAAQSRINRNNNRFRISHANGQIACKLRCVDEEVHLFINDQQAPILQMAKGTKPGTAFEFSVTHLDPHTLGHEDAVRINRFRVTRNLALKTEALDHALSIPRFSRENPHTHVLAAKTGDLLRGKLLYIQDQKIRFESKGRELTIPVDRVSHVVDVQEEPSNSENSTPAAGGDKMNMVQTTLSNGSVLEFKPIQVVEGKLLGQSPIYGAVAVPVDSIQRLRFGDSDFEDATNLFEHWIARPSKEPAFDE